MYKDWAALDAKHFSERSTGQLVDLYSTCKNFGISYQNISVLAMAKVVIGEIGPSEQDIIIE